LASGHFRFDSISTCTNRPKATWMYMTCRAVLYRVVSWAPKIRFQRNG
jgi:hypothetical protein